MSVASRAWAYAEALAWGLVSVEEVTKWIDGLALSADVPSPALTDALCAGNDRVRLVSALHVLGSNADLSLAARFLFADMATALKWNLDLVSVVARALRVCASDHLAPDKAAEWDMSLFEDAVRLAQTGYLDWRSVLDELFAFLLKYPVPPNTRVDEASATDC